MSLPIGGDPATQEKEWTTGVVGADRRRVARLRIIALPEFKEDSATPPQSAADSDFEYESNDSSLWSGSRLMSGGNRVSEMYLGVTGSRDSQVHERERVHWVCSQVVGSRVLEVGASQGIVSILLAREGFEVVGTEVEEVSFEYAVAARAAEAEVVQGRLDFRLTDGTLSDFGDGEFDAVILGEVVEHLVQPHRLLDEVDRVLARGGRLVVTTTIGLYPDPDHKDSLFPSDLIEWFGDRYVYVDSTFITFPMGRFNNIGLTMLKGERPGVRAEFLDPLLSITEQALWEVQQGAETLRLEAMSLRETLHETRADRDATRRELLEAKEVPKRARDEIEALRGQLQDQFATLAGAYASMDRMFQTVSDRSEPQQVLRLATELAETRNQLGALEQQLGELQTWKGVRVGIAMAESAHPSQLFGFPRRLRKALQPLESPPDPPVYTTDDILIETEIRPQSFRHRTTPAYPHLRILHHGESAVYGSLVPHETLDPTNLDDQLERGADFILIEPSPSTPPLGPAVTERLTHTTIPIVVYARTENDVATHVTNHTALIVTDSPTIAEKASTQTTTPILVIDPSIDPSIYNPIGFQRHPDHGPITVLTDPPKHHNLGPVQHLFPATTDLYLTPTTKINPTPLHTTATLTTPDDIATTLKHHLAVIDTPELHHTETAYLTQLLRYGATGTPIITTTSPHLTNLIPHSLLHQPATPQDTTDIIDHLTNNPFERERHSVQLRRHILTHHTHKHRLDTILNQLDIPITPPDTISIMFVTNRPDFLDHAYTQITQQDYPHKELITVLHGDNFDPTHATHLNTTCDFPTTLITAPTTWTLGDCLNAAIDASTGTLITKMDDDDYYGPHHLTDLTTARTYANADIVGKPAEFVYLSHLDLTVFRETHGSERFDGHIGGPTMMLTRSAAQLLRFLRVPRGVDVTLYERARAAGYRLYSCHPFEFVLNRHGAGHTWQTSDSHFLDVALETWPGLPVGEFDIPGGA